MLSQKKLPGQMLILILIGIGIGYSAQAWRQPDFGPLFGDDELHDASDEMITAIKEGRVSGPAQLIFIQSFDRLLSSELYDMGAQTPMEGVYFIDARGVGSFEAGHIPGSLHLDAENVTPGGVWGEDVLPRIAQDASVVVYCGGGDCDLSKRLGRALIQRGYKKVFVDEGGWNDWIDQGGPTAEGSGNGEG